MKNTKNEQNFITPDFESSSVGPIIQTPEEMDPLGNKSIVKPVQFPFDQNNKFQK